MTTCSRSSSTTYFSGKGKKPEEEKSQEARGSVVLGCAAEVPFRSPAARTLLAPLFPQVGGWGTRQNKQSHYCAYLLFHSTVIKLTVRDMMERRERRRGLLTCGGERGVLW